jgi:hypothetical protein
LVILLSRGARRRPLDERLDVHPRRRRAGLDGVRLEDGAARVPEPVVLLLDLDDVGVAGDGPEGLDALHRDAVDGVLAPELRGGAVPLREVRVCLRVDEDAARVVSGGAQNVSAMRARWYAPSPQRS